MAEAETGGGREIIDLPKIWKADIWRHFGFYEVGGKVDHAYAVCKTCHSKIKHVGNTTNFTNHIIRWHPELAIAMANSKTPQQEKSQPTIQQAIVSQLPHNSV